MFLHLLKVQSKVKIEKNYGNIKKVKQAHIASRSPRSDKQINIANLLFVFSILVCRGEEDERRKMRKIFWEGKSSCTEEKKNGEEKEGKKLEEENI